MTALRPHRPARRLLPRSLALAPFFLALIGACSNGSDDSGPTGTDAGTEDVRANDATSGSDANATDSSGITDAGAKDSSPATDSGPAESDAGPVLPRRKGQCLTDAQCAGAGAGATCAATAPGGLCNGCSGSCSLPGADQCNFGACNASCAVDNDCPTGLRCNGTGTCVLKSCSSNATCGPLHTCTGGFCRRIPCGAGVTCPAGTTCKPTSAGQLCIEDNLTFP